MAQDTEKTKASVNGNLGVAEVPAAASQAVEAKVPVETSSITPKRATKIARRVRRDEENAGDAETSAETANADDSAAAMETVGQVPPAPVGAVASAGGQAAAAGAVTGSAAAAATAAVVASPMVIGGVVAGVVGVAAAAGGGGGGGEQPRPTPPPANGAPTAAPDVVQAIEDASPVTGSVATNDRDPDGDTLGFVLVEPIAGLTMNTDGSYSFDPAHPAYQELGAGESRVVQARYSVSDGRGGTATSTLTITVTGTNDAPTATVDVASATEDATPLVGSVATNDRDIDGDVLTYALTAPVDGLTFNADGSYSFDPSHAAYQDLAEGQTRDVVVRFTVSDGHGGTASSTLTITVTGVAETQPNRAPVVVNDSFATTEDGAVVEGSVADNDTDPDGDRLTYELIEEVAGLSFNDDGSYSFDPSHPAYQDLNEGQTRDVVVRFTVSDGQGGVVESTLTITVAGQNERVNTPPVVEDDTAVVVEDQAVLVGSVAGNDSDPDGDTLRYTMVQGASGLIFNTDGSYSFDPSHEDYQVLRDGESRDVVVTYDVSDGKGGVVRSSLTITVTGTNDAPVAVEDVAEGREDEVELNGDVSTNDRDPEQGPLTYAVVSPDTVAGFSMSATGAYTLDLTLPEYQSLAQGEVLVLRIPYTVTDDRNVTTTSLLTITVHGQNDAPTASAVTVAAIEDEAEITGSLADHVEDRDTRDTLTFTVDRLPAGFTMDQHGNYAFDPAHAAYQHLARGATEDVVIEYTVSDGRGGSATQTLTITVTGVNDAPTAANQEVETGEDAGVFTGAVAAHDPDDDRDLTYTTNASRPGFTLFPDGTYALNLALPEYQSLKAGEEHEVTVEYTVTDQYGASTQATLTITVTGANDAPVVTARSTDVNEDAALVRGVFGASDPDDDATLIYTLDGPPPSGFTFNAMTGAYEFDPGDQAYQDLAEGERRPVVIHYIVTDEHGASTPGTLTITVVGRDERPNTVPTVVDEARTVLEGQGVLTGSVAGNDSDPDGDALTYTLNGWAPGFTMDSTGAYQIDTSDPVYQALKQGQTVVYEIPYLVTDGHGGRVVGTLTLTIMGTNDGPIANADVLARFEGGAEVSGSVATNDSDPDNDAVLTYSVDPEDLPAGLTFNDDGSYSFNPQDPAYDYLRHLQVLEIIVPYTVTDEHGATATSTLTITLTGTNDAPRVSVVTGEATEDGAVISGSIGATDPEGVPLVYSYRGPGPLPAGLTLDAQGNYSFDPTHPDYQNLGAGETRVVSITYWVSDGHADVSSTLTITITGTNDAPTASAVTLDVAEDGSPIAGTLLDHVHDPDTTDSLTFTLNTPRAGFTLDDEGNYTFNPGDAAYQHLAQGAEETVEVTYTVTDGKGGTVTQTLTFVVTGTNDAPTASVAGVATADEDGTTITGTLIGGDVDDGARLIFTLRTVGVVGFSFDGQTGEYTFDPRQPEYQSLKAGEQRTVQVPYTVTDEHGVATDGMLTITVTGTNDAPTAQAHSARATEDGNEITGTVATAHDDVDYEAVLRYAVVGGPTAGFEMDENGTYRFNPADPAYQHIPHGVERQVVIQYSVTDEYGETDTEYLTITVTGVNDAPTADDDIATANEDAGQLTGSVATNDGDVDDLRMLTYGPKDPEQTLPEGLTFNTDGTYILDLDHPVYQALALGDTRTVTYEYTVTDQHGATASATLTITVTGRNDGPVAVDDTAVTQENRGALSGSVANDVDPDGGAVLTYALVPTDPEIAGLTMAPGGGYQLDTTHQAYDYLGAGDVLTIVAPYTVTDEHGVSATGYLRITLTGTNDNPTAVAEVATATEDGVVIAGSVRTNDTDPDQNTTLTYEWNRVPPGLTVDAAGNYSFDPNHSAYQRLSAGATTTITANYTVRDQHGGLSRATLKITITGQNDAPVGADDAYIVAADGRLDMGVTSGVLANDRDAERDAVTVELVTGPAHGVLTLMPDGSFTYTPNAGYVGPDSFTYIPKDGSSNGQSVTVRVNVAPVGQDGLTFATDGTEFGAVGEERLVNTAKTGVQDEPTIAVHDDGSYVVAWVSAASGSQDIRAQRYSAKGEKIGTEFAVNTVTNGPQLNPSVVTFPGGSFLILWDDTQNSDVKGRRYNSDGTPAGGEFIVNTQRSGLQLDCDVTALDGGGFVVTWTDRSGSNENGYGVRAQVYDAAGSPVGGEIHVNANVTGTQDAARVVAAADGGFIVIYRDITASQVRFQKFDASGEKVGAEIALNRVSGVPIGDVDVAVLSNGHTVVIWREDGNPVDRVFRQVFDSSGQAIGARDEINAAGAVQEDVSITALTDGGYVLVWTDRTTGGGDGLGFSVMAQRFDASGAKVGDAFVVNTVPLGHQNQPRVAALPDGGFAVTWTDESKIGEDTVGAGVKIQIFGNRPPFSAIEQERLDLKAKVAIDEDTGDEVLTMVIAVGHGVLDVTAGSSGATVAGSGSDRVTITGTRAQINALLGADPSSTVGYSSTGDSPPRGTPLTIAVYDDDGVEIASGDQILTIREVNDKPSLGGDDALQVLEGEDLLFGSLAVNDHDADGDTLTYTVTSNVAGFTLNADGTYTFDPTHSSYQSMTDGATKTLTVNYTVTDGRGQATTESLTIQVTGTNDRPVAHPVVATVNEGVVLAGALNASDPDLPEISTLTYALTGEAPAGFELTGGNRYEFDASHPDYADLAPGQQLQVTIQYVVTDIHGATSEPSTLVITITGTGAGPTATLAPEDPQAASEAESSAARLIEVEPVSAGDFWMDDLDLTGNALIPVGAFDPAAERPVVDPLGGLSPVVIAEGVDPALILEGAETAGQTLFADDAHDFSIPDGVFVLSPLDPLLHGGSAVIV